MRADMHKLVCEKARRGHGATSRKWAKKYHPGLVDMEADGPLNPQRAPIARRRQYGADCKELSDHLSPLFGYLRKQVGRPWDDVYSELKAGLPDGLHMQHIMQHVGWEVERNCVEIGGKVYNRPRYGGSYSEVGDRKGELYVHPRTGILSVAYFDHYPPRPAPPVEQIAIDADHGYRKVDGIWYYEAFEIREWSWRKPVTNELVYEKRRVQVTKAQVDRKTLRRLGVRND